ncbi:MAG TPA: trypsin-like serine protease [Longimicrobium sp.]|nr:trypsin-like serine protease [Longimicrobium sp.]
MSAAPLLPTRGRWIRRGGEIVLLPGASAPGGGGMRGEAGSAPPGGLIHHPRLGYGWRRRRGAPREPDELPWPAAAWPELEEETVGEEETIGDEDTRVRVNPTTGVPYRWICRLALVFANPADPAEELEFVGSGTLISNRHVLTAAHNLRVSLPGASGLRTVASVTVRPGRNRRRSPFGKSVSAKVRVAPGWAGVTGTADFGLITLADELGARRHLSLGRKPLGFWGSPDHGEHTRIRPLQDAVLRGVVVNVSGYPRDKCGSRPAHGSATEAQLAACRPGLQGSTQWLASGRTTGPVGPALLTYDMDTQRGQTGSPVWLRWKAFRTLVAVHSGGVEDPANPGVFTSNAGVRITDAMLAQLRTWMRADGVTPAF